MTRSLLTDADLQTARRLSMYEPDAPLAVISRELLARLVAEIDVLRERTGANRIIATDRPEDAQCERLTFGCAINHTAERNAMHRAYENRGCVPW